MLNEKVFKPPSQFVDVTEDNKNNLFDYSPSHRGENPSCAFDIPHQITVLQTNFPQIKFADVKAIGAILYVLDDVASEVLTAMNVYDPDYFESDLDSFVPKESNTITSECEDIKDVNDIEEEETNEVETENDDLVEHQALDEEVEQNIVGDEALFSSEEKEELEEDLVAESVSEIADENVLTETVEIENASPEINSLDEVEDTEFDQEEIEDQEDEIDSDSCDSEIAEEIIDQEEMEEQEIDHESSSANDVETEVENNVEEANSYAADDSVTECATDNLSSPQAELIEIPQISEVTPETLISGVATLLEKLSLFTEERKRTPYLKSPVSAEINITSSQSSEAETLREYSITAPAA